MPCNHNKGIGNSYRNQLEFPEVKNIVINIYNSIDLTEDMHRLMTNYEIRRSKEITNNVPLRKIKDGKYEKE